MNEVIDSLVERIQYVAKNVLPPDATVMVVGKGDDELLKLGGRRAGHFPQNEQGVYTGFHPAHSSDAIAHLEDLRKREYNFLLIPGPYFWWLDYYKEFVDYLQRNYRIFYYEENSCLIFALGGAPAEWSISLRAAHGPTTEATSKELTTDGEGGYWAARRHLMYYKYIDVLVRSFADHARSILDVGSADTPMIEEFDWISHRVSLDLVKPYKSENVHGIRADFLAYVPEQRYDFALCLQVLEHIPDVTRFARHLFEVAENVLVSVPYMWTGKGTPGHVHDPVSRENLLEWMGRKPDYEIIVTEPISGVRRLIAYFHSPPKDFSRKAALDRLRELRARDDGG